MNERLFIFDVQKLSYLADYLHKSILILSRTHPRFRLEGHLLIQPIYQLIQASVQTDHAEVLLNTLNFIIELLPFLTGNARKMIVYDIILDQYFRFFFVHWCDAVQFTFHVILLYRLTLGRYTHLNELHEKELELYSTHSNESFNALKFDREVVKRFKERMELFTAITQSLDESDKAYHLYNSALQLFNTQKKDFDKYAKTYTNGEVPTMDLFQCRG